MKSYVKVPLLITAGVLLLAVVVGLVGVTMIHRSADASYRKQQRAQALGGGVAITSLLIIAPTWIIAAGIATKQRKKEQEIAAQRRTRR